jgi:Lsr2
MAQRKQIVLTDDLDGSAASETIRFALEGSQQEIDLNAEHAEQFRKSVQPFIDAARKAGARTRRVSRAARPSGPSQTAVREWARGQGMEVKDRGRVPDELIVKFQAAGQ